MCSKDTISLVISGISLVISIGGIFVNHKLALRRAMLPTLIIDKGVNKLERVYAFPMFGFDSKKGKYTYHISEQILCLDSRNDAYLEFFIINKKPCSFGEVHIGTSEGIIVPDIYFKSDCNPNSLKISAVIKSHSHDYYEYCIDIIWEPYEREKQEFDISFQSVRIAHSISSLKIRKMKKMLRYDIELDEEGDSALDW